MTQSKICKLCNEEKDISLFRLRSSNGRSYSWCTVCYNKRTLESYYKNKESILKQQKEYYEENKEKIHERHRQYNKTYYKQNKEKVGSAVDDLGCSIEDLKIYLESKFYNGMSWEDKSKWQIDHIIPLASFDLSDPEQFKKACHYTNLQPLFIEDHIQKTICDSKDDKDDI